MCECVCVKSAYVHTHMNVYVYIMIVRLYFIKLGYLTPIGYTYNKIIILQLLGKFSKRIKKFIGDIVWYKVI